MKAYRKTWKNPYSCFQLFNGNSGSCIAGAGYSRQGGGGGEVEISHN